MISAIDSLLMMKYIINNGRRIYFVEDILGLDGVGETG